MVFGDCVNSEQIYNNCYVPGEDRQLSDNSIVMLIDINKKIQEKKYCHTADR